jgi:hypothetical protein
MITGLVMLLLIIAPIRATVAGHWAKAAGLRTERAEAAWRQVTGHRSTQCARPAGRLPQTRGHSLGAGALDGAGRAAARGLGPGQSRGRAWRSPARVDRPVGLAGHTPR